VVEVSTEGKGYRGGKSDRQGIKRVQMDGDVRGRGPEVGSRKNIRESLKRDRAGCGRLERGDPFRVERVWKSVRGKRGRNFRFKAACGEERI